MEEAIYKRQVTKLSMSKRVIDEQHIDRHFERNDLDDLYSNKSIEPTNERNEVPSDSILSKLLSKLDKVIVKFHSHDSLLQNKEDENLSPQEIQLAWEEFENEKPQGMRSQHSIRFPSRRIGNATIYKRRNFTRIILIHFFQIQIQVQVLLLR